MANLADLGFIDPQRTSGLPHTTVPAASPRPLPGPARVLADVSVTVRGAGTRWSLTDWLEATYTTSLLVVTADGAVDLEWHRDDCSPTSLFLGASATKSALAHLVGVAVARGDLALTDRVVDHVPELASSGYAEATVLDVITMTSGVAWGEDHRDPESPASRLLGAFHEGGDSRDLLTAIPAGVAPGRRWVYNTADSQVLDWVRERATGVGFADELTALWGRLGCEHDAVVALDGAAAALAGGGLAATTRDWARIGLLALDRPAGVLPDGWTSAAFPPATDFAVPGVLPASITTLLGFGRHWWPVDEAGTVATADGSRGQFVYVDTARRLVIVKTSLWPCPDPMVDRQHRDLSILGLRALAQIYSHTPPAAG